jgi:hypothetical protein
MVSRRSLIRSVAIVTAFGATLAGSSAAGMPVAAPRPPVPAATCIPVGALSPREATAYRRFHALPRVYGHWMSTRCVPPRVPEGALAGVARAEGILVPLNGRDALAVEPEVTWIEACTEGTSSGARLVPASGTDLRDLLARLAASPAFRDVDVLEVGLARAYTSSGAVLHALRVGTLERSIQLRCYDRLDAMVEQAGRIFRDDRDRVDGLYDFLTIERSSEPLAIDTAAGPRR